MVAAVAGSVVSAASQTATLTVTVPLPAGLADGDLVVLVVRHQGSGADALSVPAGWTALVNVASATNQRAMAVLALPLPTAAGAPASVTLTRSTTAGRYVAHAFRVTGADLEAFGGGSSAYANAAPTYTVSAWTAAGAPGLAVYAAGHDTVAGTPAIVAPAAWDTPTHLATTGSGGDSTTASTTWLSSATRRVDTTAVPAGSATWNRGGAAGGGVGALILDAPPPPTAPAVVIPRAAGTLEVRAPGPDEWLDAAEVDTASLPPSYTLSAIAGTLSLPLELLTPGRPYTVRMYAEATPTAGAAAVSLILEGAVRTLAPGAPVWLEWTTTATRPLVLDVRTVDTLTVHALGLEAPVRAGRRLPGDELSLELLTPRAGGEVFVLEASRLDRDALTAARPWPGTFELDSSRLDQAYLYLEELSEWWTPVLAGARAVSVVRGARTDGLAPVAEVGTLTAEFPNAADPRQLGIRPGTPLRLYHWPSRRELFRGEVRRASVTPYRPGRRLSHLTTLEATDPVSVLAETVRYGAIVGVGLSESWTARIGRLMASAPEVSWRIVPAEAEQTPTMANTVLEASLASHLDVAATSARGAWWTGADGVVRVCAGTPAGERVAVFTDTASTEPDAWSYVDALAGWDTGDLVSVVELSNLGAAYDSDRAEWTADDSTVSVTNATLAATYGRRVASGTVNVTPGEAEAIASAYARDLSSSARVTRVRVDALPAMARAAALEVCATADAVLRGERRTVLLGRLTHTITPRRWLTDVDLAERITA